MKYMSVTLAVFHLPIAWLNALAVMGSLQAFTHA